MNQSIPYVQCASSALLGLLVHLFISFGKEKQRATAANIQMSLLDYVKGDLAGILGNLASIGLALLLVGELVNYKPEIMGWLITLSAFYGFTGSSLLISAFGLIGKKINGIVDIKTNERDGTADNVTNINDKVKETEPIG